MKAKYMILLSLTFTVLCSSISLASGTDGTTDLKDEQPWRFTTPGKKPDKARPALQIMKLPRNMTLKHRTAPKNIPIIPVHQAILAQ